MMEAIDHLKISLIAAPVVVTLFAEPANWTEFVLLSSAGVAAGVLIDLDHFLVARLNNGDWSVLRRALSDPVAAWTNWRKIIDPLEDVPAEQRLLVHISVAAVVSVASLSVNTQLFYVTAAMTSLHVLSDLYADIRNGYGLRYLPSFLISGDPPAKILHSGKAY